MSESSEPIETPEDPVEDSTESSPAEVGDSPPASAETARSRKPEIHVVPVTVAVTGATGFVGRHVCAALAEAGHRIRALVRSATKAGVLPHTTDRVVGDIFDAEPLAKLTDGVDACIHLIGIIEERRGRGVTFDRMHTDATKRIVRACEQAGVKRYVHMSALGARPGAPARYHATKYEAEEAVRASELDWTIFRPSLIHGPDGEFTDMVKAWAKGSAPPFLFMPYFGGGALGTGRKSLVQPVYVDDVARAFSLALSIPRTIGEVYPLGGPDRLTWPEMLTRFRNEFCGQGAWRRPIPIPAWWAKTIAGVSAGVGASALVPFNEDQVIMSQEDSTCDIARVESHLQLSLTPFADALAEYSKRV